MARIFFQSGITTDGRPVMSGAGQAMTTYGVPLEIVLSGFVERGWVCDWVDYCSACLRDGHKPETITSRILAACGDVYGPEHTAEVRKRLALLFP